jgi:ketosteroid isomerase-like protein
MQLAGCLFRMRSHVAACQGPPDRTHRQPERREAGPVARTPLPALAVAIAFVDAINHTDLGRLTALVHPDHELVVLDESPLAGRAANVEAWRGYFSAFPEYVIHPRHLVADGDRVAILGTTTGSHLGLSDDEEQRLGVIWLADVRDGLVARWQLVDDTTAARQHAGLPLTV